MKSITVVKTSESFKIAKRLYNHWRHKFEVKQDDTQFIIYLPEATLTMNAVEEQLDLTLETTDTETSNLERIVIEHLNRMAQTEFTVQWEHSQ